MTAENLKPPVDLSILEAAWNRDWHEDLRFLEDHLVRIPGTREPFCAPYLPWLGPEYRPGGILLMATAQNLGQFQVDASVDQREQWEVATGWPNRTLRRLERQSLDEWREVPIQPWMDGIMAALAGLWMFAESGDAPSQLQDIARCVAVTNYFKHSLKEENDSRQKDFNPKALEQHIRDRYVSFTREHLVKPEVAALKPGVVIGFTTVESMGGFDGMKPPVALAHDPSWVKQGMSGVARPGGSWRKEVEGAAFPQPLEARVEEWLDQLSSPYSTGKQEATRVYLLYTWLRFREARLAQRSNL